MSLKTMFARNPWDVVAYSRPMEGDNYDTAERRIKLAHSLGSAANGADLIKWSAMLTGAHKTFDWLQEHALIGHIPGSRVAEALIGSSTVTGLAGLTACIATVAGFRYNRATEVADVLANTTPAPVGTNRGEVIFMPATLDLE